jgi:hypothetical protein
LNEIPNIFNDLQWTSSRNAFSDNPDENRAHGFNDPAVEEHSIRIKRHVCEVGKSTCSGSPNSRIFSSNLIDTEKQHLFLNADFIFPFIFVD